jgi:hypothetical protein
MDRPVKRPPRLPQLRISYSPHLIQHTSQTPDQFTGTAGKIPDPPKRPYAK